MKSFPPVNRARGFSLVELLAVMAVMGMLLGLSTLAFHSVASGSQLARAGSMTSDILSMAHQEAITRNQDVHVFFYKMSDGREGLQIVKVVETVDGPVEQEISPVHRLPDGVSFSSANDLSPLLGDAAPLAGTRHVTFANEEASYKGFRIRPGGKPDQLSENNNFVTLVDSHHKEETPPANYFTVQINTITGKISIHRP